MLFFCNMRRGMQTTHYTQKSDLERRLNPRFVIEGQRLTAKLGSNCDCARFSARLPIQAFTCSRLLKPRSDFTFSLSDIVRVSLG